MSTADDARSEKRHEELSRITALAKGLARKGLVVMIASQLNDDGDTRESKAIVHHSDLFIRIEADDPKDIQESKAGKRVLRIVKQRQGWQGPVPVTYRPTKLLFSQWTPRDPNLEGY